MPSFFSDSVLGGHIRNLWIITITRSTKFIQRGLFKCRRPVQVGLAGMSSYLALRKFLSGDHEVTIYESYKPKLDRDPLSDDLDS